MELNQSSQRSNKRLDWKSSLFVLMGRYVEAIEDIESNAFKTKRRLIPADGYNEWIRHLTGIGRYPHLIHLPSFEPFAGLWSHNEKLGVSRCTILTAQAATKWKDCFAAGSHVTLSLGRVWQVASYAPIATGMLEAAAIVSSSRERSQIQIGSDATNSIYRS